jgi:hypothetical protein
MGYVKPYAGLILIATTCGIFKLCVPATMAIAQRYVVDELVPGLNGGTAPVHHDFSYIWANTFIKWAGRHLPPGWHASAPWGQLNILMIALAIIYTLWGISQYYRAYLSQLAGHRVILD